jgi:hypothetical protein
MRYIARVLGLAITSALAIALGTTGSVIDLTNHTAGFLTVAAFVIAYALVVAEESINLPKSKPVLIAAGLALKGQAKGQAHIFRILKVVLDYCTWIFTEYPRTHVD